MLLRQNLTGRSAKSDIFIGPPALFCPTPYYSITHSGEMGEFFVLCRARRIVLAPLCLAHWHGNRLMTTQQFWCTSAGDRAQVQGTGHKCRSEADDVHHSSARTKTMSTRSVFVLFGFLLIQPSPFGVQGSFSIAHHDNLSTLFRFSCYIQYCPVDTLPLLRISSCSPFSFFLFERYHKDRYPKDTSHEVVHYTTIANDSIAHAFE